MHEELTTWLMAPLAGAALGALFFGGLWWTTRRAATFRHPGLSVLCSLLLRMAVTMTGFFLVTDGRWERGLLCLTGFLLARGVVMWQVRRPACGPLPAERGGHHAH